MENRITRDLVIPFIDVSGTASGSEWAPQWRRIDRSTVLEVAFNPVSEDVDYICYEAPVTELTGYRPELEQEIALYRGNPVYDFVEGMCVALPVGEQALVPLLLCWPPDANGAIRAWRIKRCVLLLRAYQAAEGRVTFALKPGGDIERGAVSFESGAPVFAPEA